MFARGTLKTLHAHVLQRVRHEAHVVAAWPCLLEIGGIYEFPFINYKLLHAVWLKSPAQCCNTGHEKSNEGNGQSKYYIITWILHYYVQVERLGESGCGSSYTRMVYFCLSLFSLSNVYSCFSLTSLSSCSVCSLSFSSRARLISFSLFLWRHRHHRHRIISAIVTMRHSNKTAMSRYFHQDTVTMK